MLHFKKTKAQHKANNGHKFPSREIKIDNVTHDQFETSSAIKQQDQDQESYSSNNQFSFYKTNPLGRNSSSAFLPSGMLATQSATVTSQSSKTFLTSGILLATVNYKILNDSGDKLIERAFLDPYLENYNTSGACKRRSLNQKIIMCLYNE